MTMLHMGQPGLPFARRTARQSGWKRHLPSGRPSHEIIGGCIAIAQPVESICIGSLQIGHEGHSTPPELEGGRGGIVISVIGGARSPEGAPTPLIEVASTVAPAAESPEGASSTVVVVVVSASFPEGSEAGSVVVAGPVDGIISCARKKWEQNDQTKEAI